MSTTEIHGTCDPAYEGVRDALAANFANGDIGASAAVTVGGELVVDLWGGHRDLGRRLPWETDTIANVWSTTKMMTALCVLMLHDRGELSVDAPMAEYWPEFAAHGKDGVLVRHVMGHTAGLATFDDVVDDIAVFDWDGCCARLAAQAPQWTPGDGSGYHAETQGWLLGELVRRVTGRTLGTFYRDEVAQPVGADFHIGTDDAHFARVADLSTMRADIVSDHSRRSLSLVNTSAWRRMEMPASGGHGNARSVVQALSALANGGIARSADGGEVQLLSPATIERIFEVQADGVDRVLGREMRLGIGYGLNTPSAPLGVNDRTIWWAGWGGSMCVIDLENNLVVSYVMNQMRNEADFRAINVVYAAHEARKTA
ncbi:MAG: beta-lactamase family protein [Acidimicrobiales bacterium]|nr:beta-lactamase family protein [Acidimicrobiales bacterium]